MAVGFRKLKERAGDLWDSLNRIIHARKLEVGWEELPSDASVMPQARLSSPTYKPRQTVARLAFIDPFAHGAMRSLPRVASPGIWIRTTLPVQ